MAPLESFAGRRLRILFEQMQKDKELVNKFRTDPLGVLKDFNVPLPENEAQRIELTANLQAVPMAGDPGFSWSCAGCKIVLVTAFAALTAIILAALAATAPGDFLIAAGVGLTISLALDIPLAVVTVVLYALTAGLVETVAELIEWLCEKLGYCAA